MRLRLAAALLLLVSPLRAQCPDGAPPPCTPRSAPAAPRVAVLYFDVRSSEPSDSALADGLTEAIIDEIASYPRLQTVSRFAVQRFRGAQLTSPARVGRTLGATHLVTGVLQRVGPAIQVRVELINAATGVQQWREPFQQRSDDALELQQSIAERVAEGVGGQLGARVARRSVDPAAYSAWLTGNGLFAHRTLRGTRQAIRFYENAVQRDPGFVKAWAAIAIAYGARVEWVDQEAARGYDSLVERGVQAADRALALDSNSADAWLARAYMLRWRNYRDYAGVQEAFNRSFALDSRNAETWQQYGDYLFARGGNGTDAYRRALELDGARPLTLNNLAIQLPRDSGLLLSDSAVRLAPALSNAYRTRAVGRLRPPPDSAGALADYATAAALKRADQRDAFDEEFHVAELRRDTAAQHALLEQTYGRVAGQPVLHPQEVSDLASHMLGFKADTARALDLLERVRPRGISLYRLLRARWAQPLRSHPRFLALWRDSRPPWGPETP